MSSSSVGGAGRGGQEWTHSLRPEPPAPGGTCGPPAVQVSSGGAAWRVGEHLDCAGRAHMCAAGRKAGAEGGWVLKAVAGWGANEAA